MACNLLRKVQEKNHLETTEVITNHEVGIRVPLLVVILQVTVVTLRLSVPSKSAKTIPVGGSTSAMHSTPITEYEIEIGILCEQHLSLTSNT